MDEYTYQATRGTVTAGFVVRDGRVVEAAPILKKSVMGKSVATAVATLQLHGYKVVRTQLELGDQDAGQDDKGASEGMLPGGGGEGIPRAGSSAAGSDVDADGDGAGGSNGGA